MPNHGIAPNCLSMLIIASQLIGIDRHWSALGIDQGSPVKIICCTWQHYSNQGKAIIHCIMIHCIICYMIRPWCQYIITFSLMICRWLKKWQIVRNYSFTKISLKPLYTLPQKNFNLQIFMVTLDQGQWPKVMPTFGPKFTTYTPSKKKDNFRKVAFLLGKSVQWFLQQLACQSQSVFNLF